MSFAELILLSLSLAVDAFAVSVSCGMTVPGFGARQAVKMGAYFGAFQFGMTLAGRLLGTGMKSYIESYDHWIAFGLLLIIGGRMVISSFRRGGEKRGESAQDGLGPKRLTLLAVATSIDALAAGIGLSAVDINIWTTCGAVGITALVCSFLGGVFGKKLSAAFEKYAELAGGLVLILIGAKILSEHLAAM